MQRCSVTFVRSRIARRPQSIMHYKPRAQVVDSALHSQMIFHNAKTLDAPYVIDNALHSDCHYLKLVPWISGSKLHSLVYHASMISLEHGPA